MSELKKPRQEDCSKPEARMDFHSKCHASQDGTLSRDPNIKNKYLSKNVKTGIYTTLKKYFFTSCSVQMDQGLCIPGKYSTNQACLALKNFFKNPTNNPNNNNIISVVSLPLSSPSSLIAQATPYYVAQASPKYLPVHPSDPNAQIVAIHYHSWIR